jgi:hypothetical protein
MGRGKKGLSPFSFIPLPFLKKLALRRFDPFFFYRFRVICCQFPVEITFGLKFALSLKT